MGKQPRNQKKRKEKGHKGPKPLSSLRKTHASKEGGFSKPQPRHPTSTERERRVARRWAGGEADDSTPARRPRPVLRDTPIERERESWSENKRGWRGLEEPRPRRWPSQPRPAHHLTRGWARTGRRQGRIDTSLAERPSVFRHARDRELGF